MSTSRPSRRAVLVAAGTVPLLAACSPPWRTGAGSQPTSSAGPSATPSPPVWQPGKPYQALPGEVLPACKAGATVALERVLTWGPDDPRVSPSAVGDGMTPGFVQEALAYGGDHLASRVSVTYPQYAGISRDSRRASLMIGGTQTVADSPDLKTTDVPFIVDVRMVRTGSGPWVAERFLPARPAPARPLTTLESTVLAKDSLRWPETARADIASGAISPLLLRLVDSLSDRWRLDVQVLKSGHPYNVFETPRPSNHTLGRAVDIWAIDGVPVIDQRRARWRDVMVAAASAGANEVGGPADLDKVRGRRPYFTDAVHQDHVHLGFDQP